MANTSKKKMTANVKKKAATKSLNAKNDVKEVKEIKAEETKAIATAPEAKKITTAKEPEKIAVAKEPEKIELKKEVKVEAKAAVKEEVKEAKPAKKAVKAEAKEEVKEAKPAKKTAAKKTTAKKTTTKKAETKASKTTKKAVKAETKEEVKEAKPAKKTTAKKATVKKPTKKERVAAFEALSLDECIARMQAMGVHHVYDDYARFLLDEADMKQLEKNIIEGNDLQNKKFDFVKDGYDVELVAITLAKVAETMDIKAADYKEMKKELKACTKVKMVEDADENAAEYLKEFKLCEKLLMIGQRKEIHEASVVSEMIGADVDAFMDHFFAFAYAILPSWQYNDVKFYEDFAFAVLSQYEDLFTKYQLRILIDVADLYIKHGDFQHGDECYGYILRDNQIKDYIYYRFVSVYEAIDFNKAKALAYESLQYVDGRYTYYQNIMDVINK